MKLKEIKKFLDECHDKGIEIPRDMKVVCSDWYDSVPIEHQNRTEVEYNHTVSDDDYVKITLIPESDGQKG